MEYFLRQAWNDNTRTITEEGFDSIKDAAAMVPHIETDSGWVIQCFELHYNDSDEVVAAQDCTPELIEAVLSDWQDGGCRIPSQIIAGIVEENYTLADDGVWHPDYLEGNE